MSLHSLVLFFVAFKSAVTAKALAPTNNAKSSRTTTSNNSTLTVHFNASFPESDVSASGGLQIECNGDLYGYQLNLADCETARHYITPDSQQYEFGERHIGLPIDVPLPFLLMGDRAQCLFQTVVVGDGPTARASFNQVRIAASALLARCGLMEPSSGGIVKNIGGDNNLGVIMATHDSNVICRGRLSEPDSCKDVLSDMPASKDVVLFGPESAADVKEPLPQLISSKDEKCIVRLFSTGRANRASWYELWEAVEALFSRCGRDRRGGTVPGLGTTVIGSGHATSLPPYANEKLGEHGGIIVTLADVPPKTVLQSNVSFVDTTK